MNEWLTAAAILGATILPLGALCLRARPISGVVAAALAGVNATLALLCLAEGFHQSVYFGIAPIAAGLTWVNGLVYARFLGYRP